MELACECHAHLLVYLHADLVGIVMMYSHVSAKEVYCVNRIHYGVTKYGLSTFIENCNESQFFARANKLAISSRSFATMIKISADPVKTNTIRIKCIHYPGLSGAKKTEAHLTSSIYVTTITHHDLFNHGSGIMSDVIRSITPNGIANPPCDPDSAQYKHIEQAINALFIHLLPIEIIWHHMWTRFPDTRL